MYFSKLKIHVSCLLMLALLLVILLCYFVLVVSAAETQMYLYNGVELPDINTVWPDPDVYVKAFLFDNSSVYPPRSFPVVAFVKSADYYVSGLGRSILVDSYNYIAKVDDDVWSLEPGGGYTGVPVDAIIWANFDVLNSDGSVLLAASEPVPVGGSDPSGAVLPVFTVQPPLISWVEYNVGDIPTPVSVQAVVDDGGTISYTWYRTIYAESGAPSNVVFSTGATLVPDTSVVSDSSYYCVATNTNGEFSQSAYSRAYRVKVVESGAADPPSETPTYPSAEDIGSSVGDAFQGVLDQNDINTSEQGNSFVDQITQIVPNESQGFVNAMGGLVDSLSYGGTECVLTVPALVMPQIGDLVPQYTLLEKQEVDLESYFNMFPAFIVTLVQSLFTVALIVYCFKELYSTVSYFLVLRGGET